MVAELNYTLDGSGLSGTYIGGTAFVLAQGDNEDTTINLTITEDVAYRIYNTVGYGSGGAYGSVDTVNITLPQDWYLTVAGSSGYRGGSTYYYVYNGAGELEAGLRVFGGDIGTVTNVCFTRGSLVETETGLVAIEDLVEGDRVLTRDNGYQPIRWIGSSKITGTTLNQFPHLRPIRLKEGALGDHDEVLVSPQHRMLLGGWRAQALLGVPEALVAARDLVNDRSVTVAHDVEEVEYFHVLFDQHEIIRADGAWSESFHPAAFRHGTVDEATRDEVLVLFPELETAPTNVARPVDPIASEIMVFAAG